MWRALYMCSVFSALLAWEEIDAQLLPDKTAENNSVNLISYGPCVILQYVCKPTTYTVFYDSVYS